MRYIYWNQFICVEVYCVSIVDIAVSLNPDGFGFHDIFIPFGFAFGTDGYGFKSNSSYDSQLLFLVSVTVIVTFFPVNEGLVELVAKYWHFLGYRAYRISESMAKDSDGSTQSVWMVFDIRITFENLVP